MSTFEYSGGALCLDFANTWGNRADPAGDRLRSYGDLLRWARGAGVVSDGECDELETVARRRSGETAKTFRRAIELREAAFRLGAAVASGDPPPAADLEILNRELASVPPRELCCGGSCCEPRWACEESDLNVVLWPVVQSAADLLTSDEVRRVRQCSAPDCNWLFLDHSRGGRRRWCDMSTCGNRAKARRYYERHHRNT